VGFRSRFKTKPYPARSLVIEPHCAGVLKTPPPIPNFQTSSRSSKNPHFDTAVSSIVEFAGLGCINHRKVPLLTKNRSLVIGTSIVAS
jgi:hypothetical protein